MTEPQAELLEIAGRQEALAAACGADEIQGPVTAVEQAARQAEKAWSRSWMGYQSSVYYKDLKPPPPGAQFSLEWGFQQLQSMRTTTGEWQEFPSADVKTAIMRLAGDPDLAPARNCEKEVRPKFDADRSEALSILSTELAHSPDPYLESLKTELERTKFHFASDAIEDVSPKGHFFTRDSLALSQGFRTPPHVEVLAEMFTLHQPRILCGELSSIARKAGSHLTRKTLQRRRSEMVGTNVFIGHGRSLLWKDLKDFVQDRLKPPWDEFNRVPVAGVANVARLSEMLDAAAVAFLIMTGEDELADGTLQARLNVVHEAGLFQGRLGVGRAIVLLEEGCEEFSNLHGLGQVRFPKGNIKAAFEDVRLILEREKIIGTD
jgi:Predicted nucleotide-binding protein containing TIR-like domain